MNRNALRLVIGFCPVALSLVIGCADVPPPQPATPVTIVAYVEPPVVAAVPPPAPSCPVTGLRVASDILTACGIEDVRTGKAPLFSFDSAALSPDDQHLLGEVASCLNGGALSGRTLKLTGRADPRGHDAYNIDLGDRRANEVGRYLESQGMGTDKLNETSRGALDATGTDENGWMLDRRVDVDLATDPASLASAN